MKTLFRLGLSSTSLQGKVAIVTGAARGIGEYTSRALAKVGARVVLADISESGAAISQSITQSGGFSHFVQTDVGVEADIERLVEEAESHFGPIDILINNAARLKTGSVLELPIKYWDTGFQTNLRGPVLAIKRIVPGMIQRKHGVVISLISLEGIAFLGSYCANKMGLRSMMLSLGKEVPPNLGVSLFSVVPGSVDTPLVYEIAEALAASFGITVADVMASYAKNPGYEGLVPVEHAAAALTWFIANAPQFHGQFIDGYLPLSKFGVIDIGASAATDSNSGSALNRLPNPELELTELVQINRSLENRIEERTYELSLLTEELQARSMALEESNKKLNEASLTDPLTGLWNRRYIYFMMPEEVARSVRAVRTNLHDNADLVLVVIDLDHVKGINDTYGHHAGDTVLKDVTEVLRSVTRTSDMVVRWGGDEFLLVLKDSNRMETTLAVERMRKAIAEHVFTLDGGVRIQRTCSLGFVPFPVFPDNSSMSWEQVVDLADICMYAAKQSGRNAWVGLTVESGAIEQLSCPPSSWNIPAMIAQNSLTLISNLNDPGKIIWNS